MKSFITIIFLLPIMVYGQKSDLYAIVSQGDYDTSRDMSVSWTLGEFFVETVIQGDRAITQGFQQPNIEIDKLPSTDINTIEASLFPNPTSGWLKLQMTRAIGRYRVEIIDLTGRVLSGSWYEETEVTLDVSEFSAGQYFIYVTNPIDERRVIFSIVKF